MYGTMLHDYTLNDFKFLHSSKTYSYCMSLTFNLNFKKHKLSYLEIYACLWVLLYTPTCLCRL